MRVVRRAGLYVVLPLAVIAVAAFGWYRFSDTARDARYRDKLAGFCQGMIPEAESAVFTGHQTGRLGRQFHNDHADGMREAGCEVDGLKIDIADIPDDLIDDESHIAARSFFKFLGPDGQTPPMSLGGGWEGYTDLSHTSAVLPCTNRHASVLVSAEPGDSPPGDGATRQVARLVTATAVRAARHYGCTAKPGGPIPPVPRPARPRPARNIGGTCAGIPVRQVVDTGEVNWVKQTAVGGTPSIEECVLGDTKASAADVYDFQADYGPYAQRLRTTPDDADGFRADADSGISHTEAWATARCPGHTARALFFVTATEDAAPTRSFLKAGLRAFAVRATKRHSCTDLRLPH